MPTILLAEDEAAIADAVLLRTAQRGPGGAALPAGAGSGAAGARGRGGRGGAPASGNRPPDPRLPDAAWQRNGAVGAGGDARGAQTLLVSTNAVERAFKRKFPEVRRSFFESEQAALPDPA